MRKSKTINSVRLHFLEEQERLLAPYAMKASESRGREYSEKEPEIRTPYQRDRDRVVYSTAFRRLEYKTQVFVNHEGDHYRTRLTHTLETSQIARTIARVLHLNEDLAEAVSLAHDLGHGPFGHAGEWALLEMMKNHGGFEHNEQALRIVEKLEESYVDFPGLNLTYETREGMKKHPERFYKNRAERYRTLEGDLVDVADEIAYSSHDLDDGFRSDLITEKQAEDVTLWRDAVKYIDRKYPRIRTVQKRRLAIRLIINALVTDLIENTRAQIEKARVRSRADLQKTQRPIVIFSDKIKKDHIELKRFLHKNLYEHYRVIRMTHKGQRFLKSLFKAYLEKPSALPPEVLRKSEKEGLHRAICDYLAGMTDRFALDEYKRFFEPYERV